MQKIEDGVVHIIEALTFVKSLLNESPGKWQVNFNSGSYIEISCHNRARAVLFYFPVDMQKAYLYMQEYDSKDLLIDTHRISPITRRDISTYVNWVHYVD